MKIFIKILLCTSLVLSISCKKKLKASENEDDIIVEMKSEADTKSKSAELKTVKDCDEFIDQYEAWMEDYFELMEKYKENPVDLIGDPEYSKMAIQAMDWGSKWSIKLATSCAANPQYEKRIKEIQEKMEKKMKKIGLKK